MPHRLKLSIGLAVVIAASPLLARYEVGKIKESAHQAVGNGDLYAACNQFAQVVALQPKDRQSLYNLAWCLIRCNEPQAACHWYEQVLALAPHDEMALFGLAKARLASGQYEKAWDLFEWRYGSCAAMHRRYKVFELTPASCMAKEVVLVAEWGMGDALMCLRYAFDIKRAGATKLIVQVPHALVPLVSLCPYIDQVITAQDMVAAHTVDMPILSLPRIFGTTVETIPTPMPYLFADERLVAYWREQLAIDDGYKVGICWSSHESNLLESPATRRNIPLSCFEALAQLPGVSVYSLQKGFGQQELAAYTQVHLFRQFDKLDEAHGPFMDTVAIMHSLDLIITADTSIAHIAGALGRPVWVLLPFAADWRWLTDRCDTPWYSTMRLFRQQEPGDWSGVVLQVLEALSCAKK